MAKRRGGGKRFSLQWKERSATNKLVDLTNTGVKRAVFRVVTDTTEDLFQDVKKATPVDTGKARKAWRRTKPRPTARIPKGKVKNFAPYITILESGSSRQAPNGILLPALKRAEPKYGRDLAKEMQREFDKPARKR